MVGKTFGKWTVLKELKTSKRTKYLCKCACGTEKNLDPRTLRNGDSKSCGCSKFEKIRQTRVSEMLGKKFGSLTPIELTGAAYKGSLIYKCRCDCGKIVEKLATRLRDGTSHSCGCRYKAKIYAEAGFNALYHRYKKDALRRNLEFALEKEDFRKLTSSICYYCGVAPFRVSKNKKDAIDTSYVYNGIDRKNNTLGYVVKNCVPCCLDCNEAKSNKDFTEWTDWLQRIKNHTMGAQL